MEYGKTCFRSYGSVQSTLSAAKDQCNQNSSCIMITDTSCDGKDLRTCIGPMIDSEIGTCVWYKGKNHKITFIFVGYYN